MKRAVTDKQRINSEGEVRRLANLKPFQKGQSGNPKGRPKTITLSEAYRSELAKVDETDPQRRTFAEILAEQVISKAKRGDVQAAREIADRAEGKARQTVALSLDRHEQLEQAIAGIMQEQEQAGESCSREEAIAALAVFVPEANDLLN